MPLDASKGDLRQVKTKKALNIAMLSLLDNRSFGRITVRDICEEAVISRATFYTYFNDKYGFLRDWLSHFRPENINENDSYTHIEKEVNQFVCRNETIIRHLLYDADNETLGVLFNFILSAFNLSSNGNEKTNPRYIVISNFFAGGMIFYLMWLSKNRFPPEVMLMNRHLHEIIEKFIELKSE